MALISKLANAYASLTQPAGQRFGFEDPRARSLGKSAALRDLSQTPEQERMSLDLTDEQKKRKRLLETQRFGGTMSAAYMSLLGDAGNQF